VTLPRKQSRVSWLPPDASAWRCPEFLQLPASSYLWADKSAPATGKRFYRAVEFAVPTNLVFIPPGTFRMGSPSNEVDRFDWEGPQTAVTVSRGFWMGKCEVTQGEYQDLLDLTEARARQQFGETPVAGAAANPSSSSATGGRRKT
jgi:formylglycine-generating enzyme required for sulfatase activity